MLYLRFSPSHQAEREADIPEKSIAVLPFENYSEEKENAFFADGIQDDLLTNLAKIKALTVISRTSVMKYRDVGARNLKEIGKSLGVANILEGSVRREKNRVAVNVQLIDALSDRHIWAQRYDRTLADSLGLEGELATEIADALRAQLTPEEKVRVAKKPTQNADAYDLYLRALPYEQGPDTLLQDYRRAEQLYQQAIDLDPNFALAHARLATTCAEIFHFHEPLDSWKARARREAETCPQLATGPGRSAFCPRPMRLSGLTTITTRLCASSRSLQSFLPNDSNIGALVAAIRRRQGSWKESLALYERAGSSIRKIRTSPATSFTPIRRCANGRRRGARSERWCQMAPDSLVAKIQMGYVDFFSEGQTRTLRDLLAQIPAGTDPDGAVTAARWDVAMIERDFAGRAKGSPQFAAVGGRLPQRWQYSENLARREPLYLAQGDTAAAAPSA